MIQAKPNFPSLLIIVLMLFGLHTQAGAETSAETSAETLAAAGAPSLIHVSAEGTTQAPPDQAEFRLNLESTRLKSENAREEVNEQVSQLLGRLEDFELAPNSLDSSQTRIQPQYEYLKGSRKFLGYRFTRTVSFILADLDEMDDLLEAITDIGVNQLDQIRFTLSEDKQYENMALDNAIRNSRQLAERIASGYGVTLGKIHSVTHHSQSQGPVQPVPMMRAEMAVADQSSPTYHQKDLEYTARVDVAFTFE